LQVNRTDCYHPGVPRSIPGRHFARNLIRHRNLIFQLVKRDFQQRYVGSAAGWLWGVIHPLVLLASYTFIFSYCLRIPPGAGETQSYPLWLFSGMLPWLLFSDTVQRSAGSIVDQSNLVTKTLFPSEIVPVSIFLSSLMSHLIAVALFMGVAAVTLQHLSPAILLLPAVVVVLGLFAIGIGWIAASLQVYLRDTAQILTVALTFWLWLTPIFIPEEKFPAQARFVLAANPLAHVVRAYRKMLLANGLPAADLAIATAFGVTAFVLGGLFFRVMKRGFADVL
jgi:ABC-type polysaccharide/polyol phosphate export permease